MPDVPASIVSGPTVAASEGFARIDGTWNMESGRYYTRVQVGVGADNRPRLELERW